MTVERVVHHFPLDPASRQVRLALGEKRLPFSEVQERYWERDRSFLALNPSGLTPVLVEINDRKAVVVCEARAILEHLEEAEPEPGLMGRDPAERAETRRLLHWFDRKFDYEVNGLLLHENFAGALTCKECHPNTYYSWWETDARSGLPVAQARPEAQHHLRRRLHHLPHDRLRVRERLAIRGRDALPGRQPVRELPRARIEARRRAR